MLRSTSSVRNLLTNIVCKSVSFSVHYIGRTQNYSDARMPKKKSKKTSQSAIKEVSQAESNDEPVSMDKDGKIRVTVLAKPGSKHSGISGLTSEGVGVHIAAQPVDGEANTELVRYISKLLGLRKSDVSLDKGAKSRNKTLVISSDNISVEQVLEKLQSDIG